MIEFTFTHCTIGAWTITIPLVGKMTGGEAFDQASAEYQLAFPNWRPGHPDVTVTMKGR